MKLFDLCCSHCHEKIKEEDLVTLDIINTVTHIFCEHIGYPVKDSGTLREMQKKYSFK